MARQSAPTAAVARAGDRIAWRRFLQACCWLGAAAWWLWANADPRFRDAEGVLRATACLPIAIGAALAVLGWGVTTAVRAPAGWTALALVGQGAALQLIEAGPYMRYQHYRSLDRLLADGPFLALLCLGLQSVLVGAAISRRWPAMRAWLRGHYRRWQLAALLLLVCLFSATVSADPRRYVLELVVASFVQLVNLANVVLIAWSLPAGALRGVGSRIARLVDGPAPPDRGAARRVDRLAVVGGLWVTTLAAALSLFVYGNHPHIPDEVVYLYQARYLAAGTLTMPAPPVPEGFDVYLMRTQGERWYPTPPAGWPAVLAVGTALGVPWLVNPLLAGLNVVLAFVLVRTLYDRRTARITVLLLCASPWNLFMGMNFMTHTASLTCALLAALCVIRSRERRRVAWAAAAGVAVGALSLIRPLEGVVVAGLLGLWSLGVGGARLSLASICALVLATAATAATVLPYNRLLTGDATVFPIMAYTDERFAPGANAYGFGPDRGMGWPIDPFPGHGVADALVNADLNAFSINIELLGWSTGSLLLALLLLLGGQARRADGPLLAVIAAVFAAHFFYYFSGGPDFGARYWFLMLVPCLALTARGLQALARALGDERDGRLRVAVAVVVLCGSTLITYVPWRALDKYHHYLAMRPDVRALAAQYGFGRSLVLIGGDAHPDYASAAVYNPLDLRAAAPVYAWDRDDAVRDRLLAAYADRPVWLVDGPSRTRGPYRVVAGPLSASDLRTLGTTPSAPRSNPTEEARDG